MAEHYDGRDLVVEFAGVDISAYARSFEVTESAEEPEEIDVTTKGDTERQTIEGFPGSQSTDVAYTMLDIYDALHAFGTVAINTKSTLTMYPKGKTSTYPMLTLQNARLIERGHNVVYDEAVELTGSFTATNSLTRGTYSA
jgi:hypothetical protein